MTIALYQQVSEDLLRKITSGKLPVGSLLPPNRADADLSNQPHTVRTALHQLQARGLISRRRNRGTMVERCRAAAAHSPSRWRRWTAW